MAYRLYTVSICIRVLAMESGSRCGTGAGGQGDNYRVDTIYRIIVWNQQVTAHSPVPSRTIERIERIVQS
jgi:hypothetical protein